MTSHTRTTVSRASVAASAAVLGLVLGACGTEGGSDGAAADDASATTSPSETPTTSDSPSESPTESTSEEPRGPACAEVWVAGQVLPEKYTGCQDAEKDTWVEAMVYRCSSGQRLVTFRRTFYAAKGEAVNETATPLARDPKFQQALASCGA